MQLRTYEALEEEVDETVLRAAGQPDLAGTRDSMLQVVRGLPSSPERRVKQALQLVRTILIESITVAKEFRLQDIACLQ